MASQLEGMGSIPYLHNVYIMHIMCIPLHPTHVFICFIQNDFLEYIFIVV